MASGTGASHVEVRDPLWGRSMSLRLFQVGFNRCGTKSLHQVFVANGHRAAHWQGGRLAAAIEVARRRSEPLLSRAGTYAVYTDMELRSIPELRKKWFPRRVFRQLLRELEVDGVWTPIYAYKYFAQLDEQYPGSKFLLNTRDVNRWIESRFRFKDDYRACIHGDEAHGSTTELAACWEADWHAHHAAVQRHFAGRPDDLLVFNVEKDPIEALIRFVAPAPLDPRHWHVHNPSGIGPRGG